MTINIAEFEAVLPDAEAIRTAAGAFKDTVGSINTTATVTAFTWARLQGGVYDVPGKEQVFSAFLPVLTASGDLVESTATVHTATTAYADAVDALEVRLQGVKADAASFYSEVDGRPQDEWDDDEGLVEKELAIIGALDQLYADLQAAQRDCANAISGIYGGPSYVQTTEEGPAAHQVAYGYSKDQLDAAAAAGDVPWGKPTEWDKPWYRDVGDGIASFGKGLWSGVTGTVTGLGNMVGLNGSEAFEQTWAGIGKLAVNVAIVTSPLAQVALRASGNGDVVDRAGEELLAVGKAAIHWDEWQSDPAYAAGATTFDLATILLTAGAGATAKVGSVAGKVATIGGKAGTVVRVTGIGKVAVGTVKATDFVQGVKVSTITVTADVGRTVIAKVDDVYRAGTAGVGNTVRHGVAVLNDAGDRFVNALSPQSALAGAGGVSTRPGTLLNAVETHTGSRGGAGSSTGAPSGTGSPGSSSSGTSSSNRAEEFRRLNEGRYGQTVDQQPVPVRTDAGPMPDAATGTGAAEAGRSSSPGLSARPQAEGAAGTTTPMATSEPATSRPATPGNAVPEHRAPATDATVPTTEFDTPAGSRDGGTPTDAARGAARPSTSSFAHPESSHGTPVPDVIHRPAEHAVYGLRNDAPDAPSRLEGAARLPDEVHADLRGIVDPDQPPYGLDEHGHELTEAEYANRYGKADDQGAIAWDRYPDNAGAVEGSVRQYDTLDDLRADLGDVTVDRIGANSGSFLAVEGTPWEMRSLPVNTLGKELHHFELDDLPGGYRVEVSEIAPAFGRPGGGTQLRIVDAMSGQPASVDRLIDAQVLRETGPLPASSPLAPESVDGRSLPGDGPAAVGDAGVGGQFTTGGDAAAVHGVREPFDQADPSGVGRSPDLQPRVHDSDSGPGSWEYEPPQKHGGPYQRFVTGVELDDDGRWLEYSVPTESPSSPSGRVKFDGHYWDKGPPPVEVFQEAKGEYAFFDKWGALDDTLDTMVGDQLTRQVDALEAAAPEARLEWNFAEQVVADKMQALVNQNRIFRDLSDEGRIIIKWTPMT